MNEYSLLNIFQELYKWKKSIITAVLLVGILTTIICLLLPNYYKASTTFYAANPSLANPAALGYEQSTRYIYGTGEDIDRLFSIINSNEMSGYLIKKFDLYKSYGLDSTTEKGRFNMSLAFKENYKTLSTKYDAIELSVEDKDPKMSANIANAAVEHANEISQQLIKSAQLKNLESIRSNIEEQEKRINELSDTIRKVKSKSKMVDPYFESENYSQEAIRAEAGLADAKAKANFYSKYESKKDSTIKYNAIAAGLGNKLIQIRSSINTFYEVSPWIKKMEQEYSRAGDQLSIEKEKEKLLSSTYSSSFPGLHVIDKAYPPLNKSRPKRSLIILASMLITFITSVLGILMIQSLKKG